jgi:hypothetical protein
MRRNRLTFPALVLGLAPGFAFVDAANALTFVIANGTPQIYLRIGRTGGTASVVSFTVTGANGGNGTPIAGTVPANAGAASAAETPNFAVCPGNYVRIVARARSTAGTPRTATLTVNSTAGIVSGANTIPFTQFDWISDDAADLPAGTFTGAPSQPLTSFTTSREVGACHQFRFLNTQVYPAGTYAGNLIYNLQMP